MPPPLRLPVPVPRSASREGLIGGSGGKPPRSGKKPAVDRSGSTAQVSGWRLPTHADIIVAIAWRLDGIPVADVGALADVLRPFADDFRESRPEVAAVLADIHRAGDRRSARTLTAAVLASDAEQRGDVAGFLLAGFEVLESFRQSNRGKHHNRKVIPLHRDDALDRLIRFYLNIDPNIACVKLFDDFKAMAGGLHKVLADFDPGKDELVCQLNPKATMLTNITSGEFGRRMRRLRKSALLPH